MATVPLSGSNIRVLSGVPFSNDYKNTRWFDTKSEQTNYFLGKTTVYTKSDHTFQRADGHTFISVQKGIDDLWGANYLMFQNTKYNSKWFYAFVTRLEYVNANHTKVHFQIDVFQTWKFDMDFKTSFVVREHCKLWNSDGTPVANTVDEGLNYGTEYDTVSTIKYTPYDGYKWLVIVSKTPIHSGASNDPTPTVIGTPQPLSVYVLPFKDDNSVPAVNTLKGMGFSGDMSSVTKTLHELYTTDDAVNNIVSLYVTDYTGIKVDYVNNVFTFPDNNDDIQVKTIGEANVLYVKKVEKFVSIEKNLGDKWVGYEPVTESKLLMYPYTQLVLDDFKGNRVSFKNEYINTDTLRLLVKGSLGTSNKTSYGIKEYNFLANGLQENMSDEFALINNEPSDIPIVTDMLSAYLQGNRNSLQNQKDSIFWNGMMGIAGGAVGVGASAAGGSVAGVASGAIGTVQGTGNAVLQLQGLQAKQNDIANIPPQLQKMGSNTSYTLGNDYNGVYIVRKQIKTEYIRKLTDYFHAYGYKVNETKIPNFHTRKHFNYVQTLSCNILGNFNNEDLNELKAVFDNGITFWHVDDVGNYNLENEVI
jgi:hypothetical protein